MKTEAPAAPLWGKLEPGRYAVGFRQWQRYDNGRAYRYPRKLDGTPRTGEMGRPMQITIWYPVDKATTGALLLPLRARPSGPMTMGDSLDLLPTETRFGPTVAEARDNAEAAFLRFASPETLTLDARKRVRPLRGRAFRDASPAKGPFPLVLYSLFPAAMSPASAEYLASHGYVVVTMPRMPLLSGFPDSLESASDIDAKVRDMDFLVAAMRESGAADLTNIGVTGVSAGGWWGLSEVMRNQSARAMVSLDTVMLFDSEARKAWKTLSFFDSDAVRVPVLHMIRKEWVPREDQKMWDAVRFADPFRCTFRIRRSPTGTSSRWVMPCCRRGPRQATASAIESAFLLFNRYTLAFFDAHLRGDLKARQWLARDPLENGAPVDFVVATARKAESAPRSQAELLGALEEDGTPTLAAAYCEDWKRLGTPPLPEPLLNLGG